MSTNPIRPEDVLPDGVDKAFFDSLEVRKGSVKAFLANIVVFENPHSSSEEREVALLGMRMLAPALIALGMHEHVTFNNPRVEQILIEARLESF
jgi:hypothetical protein